MPTKLSLMKNPDPFVMDKDTVKKAVADFLLSKGFNCDALLKEKQPGVDVKAVKGGINVFVESKGSQKIGAEPNEVFDNSQIVTHLAMQIHTLMRYAQQNKGDHNVFVLANPDISRIRKEYLRVGRMVEQLGFICMWVQEDQTVKVEGSEKNKLMRIFSPDKRQVEVLFDQEESERFIKFLRNEYSLGESSAKDAVGRINGMLNRGIYNGENVFSPKMEAAIIREYPKSKVDYILALKRFISFQQKRRVEIKGGW